MQKIPLRRYYHDGMKKFVQDDEGASSIEYALLASLIGAFTIGAQRAMGDAVLTMYVDAIGIITGAMGS